MRELLELADDDARERWDSLRLCYTEPAGLTPLREAVADLYGGAVTPQQVLVCAPEEGVFLAMKALLRPGDRVVCAYPAYQSLYELALSAGCALDYWEPSWDAASGKLRFDVARLEELVTKGGPPPRLVVVNFPHNPSGATLAAADAARVVAAAAAAGAYLFSDEMYWRLEPDASLRLPPAVTLYDKAITLCGLSKSWALPGLRIGWLACRDAALIARVAALKDYTTICSAGPSEVLALIAVRATEQLTARARAIVAANTAAADAFFARWARLFEWAPPDAGPIAFPRLRVESLPPPKTAAAAAAAAGAEGAAPVDAFCQAAVDEAGVLLLPASVYDHAASLERGHFRIGLGRKSAPECLARLDAFLVARYGAP
ncbi:MAG: aminotransferase, classes I and II [Monoraphidium minutum]|nr:MAG: aminotransferase, classes I and II [Monoraphidium minutum]